MTLDEQVKLLWDAIQLVHAVSVHATTLPADMTAYVAARPIILSEGLSIRLSAFRQELLRKPYVTGLREVAVIETHVYGDPVWRIWTADDFDFGPVVDQFFASREAAEEYAVSHGMRLAPDQEVTDVR